jgi:hypothetical protein
MGLKAGEGATWRSAMGEILGLGLSHFPGFMFADADMAMRIKQNIRSDRVPAALKDPRNWPAPMQAEWGDDEGTTFAAAHRAQFVAGVRRLRAALDDFQPDAVVMFGDDQYENFREDLVPPFCIYIMPEFPAKPFLRARGRGPQPNVWGEPPDTSYTIPGHPHAARFLAKGLLEERFDLPYAYQFHHLEGLGHAFIHTLLYLDYDRRGWEYPIIPFHVNAYGSNVVRNRGGSGHLFATEEREADPPAPSPQRCFELGQAIARRLTESPWRVALIASSSWSHAFLVESNHYIYPDVAADRQRFADLAAGNYAAFRDLSLEAVEQAGEHELLNWIPLMGAMYELGQQPACCDFLESYLMNSCKSFALFPPKVAVGTAAGPRGEASR